MDTLGELFITIQGSDHDAIFLKHEFRVFVRTVHFCVENAMPF